MQFPLAFIGRGPLSSRRGGDGGNVILARYRVHFIINRENLVLDSSISNTVASTVFLKQAYQVVLICYRTHHTKFETDWTILTSLILQ